MEYYLRIGLVICYAIAGVITLKTDLDNKVEVQLIFGQDWKKLDDPLYWMNNVIEPHFDDVQLHYDNLNDSIADDEHRNRNITHEQTHLTKLIDRIKGPVNNQASDVYEKIANVNSTNLRNGNYSDKPRNHDHLDKSKDNNTGKTKYLINNLTDVHVTNMPHSIIRRIQINKGMNNTEKMINNWRIGYYPSQNKTGQSWLPSYIRFNRQPYYRRIRAEQWAIERRIAGFCALLPSVRNIRWNRKRSHRLPRPLEHRRQLSNLIGTCCVKTGMERSNCFLNFTESRVDLFCLSAENSPFVTWNQRTLMLPNKQCCSHSGRSRYTCFYQTMKQLNGKTGHGDLESREIDDSDMSEELTEDDSLSTEDNNQYEHNEDTESTESEDRLEDSSTDSNEYSLDKNENSSESIEDREGRQYNKDRSSSKDSEDRSEYSSSSNDHHDDGTKDVSKASSESREYETNNGSDNENSNDRYINNGHRFRGFRRRNRKEKYSDESEESSDDSSSDSDEYSEDKNDFNVSESSSESIEDREGSLYNKDSSRSSRSEQRRMNRKAAKDTNRHGHKSRGFRRRGGKQKHSKNRKFKKPIFKSRHGGKSCCELGTIYGRKINDNEAVLCNRAGRRAPSNGKSRFVCRIAFGKCCIREVRLGLERRDEPTNN